MYDYFVAPLRCPRCGVLRPADSTTDLQTHVRDDADGRELPVGTVLDPLEVRPEDLVSSGYLPTGRAAEDARALLLDLWQCPSCGRGDNWAAIELRDGTITSIEAVTLDQDVLARADFISDQCAILAGELTGRSPADFWSGGADAVAALRQHLPGAPSR